MEFDADKINEIIDEYVAIRCFANGTKNFTVPEFKVLFNKFYKIRQKKPKWYNDFYNTFANYKRTPKSFEDLMKKLYKATGEIHPSFCSKIITTFNPNKPTWDKYVLQFLGYILDEPKDPYERIHYYATIYDEIEKEFNAHLGDKNVKDAIVRFDEQIKIGHNLFVMTVSKAVKKKKNGSKEAKSLLYVVPDEFELTPIEKINLMLWSKKDDRMVSIFDYNKLLEKE